MKNSKPNFLIILSDCTRPDKLSCYGYKRNTTPNIDKLAKEATVFTNAYTQGVWTLPTHASLFTGLYPSEHGLLSATEKLDVQIDKNIPTLAGQLKEEGYMTAGISNNPWVGRLTGMDRGFDFFMESDGTIEDHIGIDFEVPSSIGLINKVQKLSKGFFFKLLIPYLIRRPVFTEFSIDLAKKIISYVEKNDRNFFIFMNLMDTHQPYYPPRKELKHVCNHRSYPWSSLIANYKIRQFYQGKNVENISEILNDYYDASLHHQDKHVGSLFSYLRSENLVDETMIFFTADHGKNLGEYDVNENINCMK
ncbi:MAG: sulfatase, partial [Petrotogales bacterium]